MKIATSLLLVAALLGFALAALAEPTGIAVTLTSPQTTYTPGVNNTFTFNVALVVTGAEYVDRFQFAFPAGVTIVSGTPASGPGSCGGDNGVQTICSPAISWAASGVPCSGSFTPTGCGAYNDALNVFTVVASIPAGFTGPMTVTLNSIGDGFLLPGGTVDTDTVVFQQAGATCTLTPPANIAVGTDAGICGAVVNYGVGVSGNCGVVTCTPAPGSTFGLGTTTVTCTSSVGGASTSFTVTVTDDDAPVLTCPDVETTTTLTTGGAALTFAPTVLDNCTAAPAVTCVPPSGTFFPLGDTTVNCTSPDAAGNVGSCAFTASVLGQSVLEIPTLAPAGLAGLALLLAGGAVAMMRRRRG